MRLLLMRHGIAADLGGEIRTDAERPLTLDGRDKTEQVAQGLLACGEPIDLIATSPLLRAVQTAEIVHQVYGADKINTKCQLETWPELEQAGYAALQKRLIRSGESDTALLVGHEPGMSRFAAQLLTGSPTGLAVEFKKAAICALDAPSLDQRGDALRATLLWFATPKQLRLMRW